MASKGIPAYKHWFTTTCVSGKRGYPDRRSAKEAARMLAKMGLGNMRPYDCSKCEHIHVGHPHVYKN